MLGAWSAAHATSLLPAGNRSPEQPLVPGSSKARTQALKTSYDAKYSKIYALLERDAALRKKIGQVAKAYEIDPLHVVGAIIGEHTYNVGVYDQLQTYYVKAVSYVNSSFAFSFGSEGIDEFVKRPEFHSCAGLADSYALWTCREDVWERSFRGKRRADARFPDDRFSAVFFQPFYAGQTFGIGQLNPLTALQMSDLVHDVSGLPKLDPTKPQQIYRTIMDPDLTLPYVAATIKKSIEAYRDIADFDISSNPGITATLYNIGRAEVRAAALKAENLKRRQNGLAPRLPQENYYGWLVNEKLQELQVLF
jgi:hypothetical protein